MVQESWCFHLPVWLVSWLVCFSTCQAGAVIEFGLGFQTLLSQGEATRLGGGVGI